MLKKSVFYTIGLLTCMIWGVILFPTWHENAEIPLVPLVGLGSWLFGRHTGFILIFPIMLYCFCLEVFIYPDSTFFFEAKGSGYIIIIITVTLFGNLRNKYDAIKTLNHQLDQRIAERNIELSKLTSKLLQDTEAKRILHGQLLHDGIGQQLTGIQLYCASLAEQLAAENNPLASLAFSMRTSAEKAHNIIRKTARMLFPVRMQETGLIPAINELTSCLSEMQHLSIDAKIQGDFEDLPDNLALAIYRICHESAIYAATELEARNIHLDLCESKVDYHMSLRQDGMHWSVSKGSKEWQLILYRLHSIGGMHAIDERNTIKYQIPKVA